ncbi:DUF6122 family protein [Albibacterium bauzanense]|uniref:LexA-binding, inner membrane-associated hydrolase n=1 Tax=Albibacterium bauzanense TaxID=653929 RepID=A0A4R1M1M7_9SPHI|nr:DUF6122 family protein [Albibacterium bauzanense]TCK84754.1 hypothetical protein C8N28_0047 [Albibacterium bauzanense]
MIHIALHFLVPAIIAWFFYKDYKIKAFLIMIATMLVDLDHLLAVPIYDPMRCSIGYHPLHSYYIIPFYFILLFFPKFRLIGIGLVIHMLLDFLDCFI